MRVLFHSTFAVINAEKICRIQRIPARVVPVPREISSDCGMSLVIEDADRDVLAAALDQANIEHHFYEDSAPQS